MISTNSSSVASDASTGSDKAADLTVRRVRHPLEMRRVRVVRVASVTPGVRCLTFAGDRLRAFVSAGFDDHVKLVLPRDRGAELVLPEIGANGAVTRDDAPPVVLRDYTPRRFDTDRGELDIELDVHGDGPASRFARAATPGQDAGIGGPRGSFVVPVGFAWHVLVGDETALPAIARRLEELPESTRALVVVRTNDVADRRELASRAQLEVTWCSSDDELTAAVRELSLPTTPGYAWAAGEASAMRAIRSVFRDDHHLSGERTRVSAYWKRGAAGHHEAVS